MIGVTSYGPGWLLVIALAGVGLASCSTTSTTSTASTSSSSKSYFDAFKQKPTTTLLLIESNPAGAQAQTSFGKTCTTPCTMQVGESGYVPQTLTVHAQMSGSGWTTAPSPVFDPPSLFPTLEKDKGPAVARKPSKPRA